MAPYLTHTTHKAHIFGAKNDISVLDLDVLATRIGQFVLYDTLNFRSEIRYWEVLVSSLISLESPSG